MFADRSEQFEKFVIPRHDIARVRAAVTDMWADAPGGRPTATAQTRTDIRRFGRPRHRGHGVRVREVSGREHLAKLPYGMHDIIGNAMHWDHSPTLEDDFRHEESLATVSDLPEQHPPMPVINGADDEFVPQADTLGVQGLGRTPESS